MRLGLWIFILTLCSAAHSQTPPLQQDLYLQALQALADGRQKDASDTLMQMIDQAPEHAGAWLDLAIIQCELGHAQEAERLFQAIEARFSPPQGILEVIASYRTRGCQEWRSHSQTSFMLARGMDNNVNQGANNPNFSIGSGDTRIDLQLLPEFLPQADRYTFLSGEYSRDLSANGSVGFVQLQARRNDVLTNYDTTALTAGLEHPWRIGDWAVRGTGMLSLLTLGGRLYQKQNQLRAQITPPLQLPEKIEFSVATGVAHVQYPTLTNFDANVWDLRGLLTYGTAQSRAQASLGYLADNALQGRPGGNRKGWFASLQDRFRITDDVFADLGWTRQTWLGQSAYSPGVIDQTRYQVTQVLHAKLIVPVATHQAVQLEWRGVRNDENISLFQYNSRLLQLSWQWLKF